MPVVTAPIDGVLNVDGTDGDDTNPPATIPSGSWINAMKKTIENPNMTHYWYGPGIQTLLPMKGVTEIKTADQPRLQKGRRPDDDGEARQVPGKLVHRHGNRPNLRMRAPRPAHEEEGKKVLLAPSHCFWRFLSRRACNPK
jgi:hypothetical protein